MARPIAPTPKLDKKSSDTFLQEVSENLKKKSYPISTPNIDETIKEIMFYARKKKK